jgi:hypothetical protein
MEKRVIKVKILDVTPEGAIVDSQCTLMSDSQGTEIWEGDRIRCFSSDGDSVEYIDAVVAFEDGSFIAKPKSLNAILLRSALNNFRCIVQPKKVSKPKRSMKFEDVPQSIKDKYKDVFVEIYELFCIKRQWANDSPMLHIVFGGEFYETFKAQLNEIKEKLK